MCQTTETTLTLNATRTEWIERRMQFDDEDVKDEKERWKMEASSRMEVGSAALRSPTPRAYLLIQSDAWNKTQQQTTSPIPLLQ
jgi:hypothetical protein